MHPTANTAPTPSTPDHANRAAAESTVDSPALPTTGDLRSTGSLVWGVKETFLRYASSLADGICEVSPQVRLPGKGRFEFPFATAKENPWPAYSFADGVTFRGHRDFLFVTVSKLGLAYHNGAWLLTCRHPEDPTERLRLATARHVRADHDHHSVRISVVLSPEGSQLFGGNYTPGEPLSDLVLYLPKSAQPQHNNHES